MTPEFQFAGSDYGMFVFGRTILAKNPAACLTFFYKVSVPTGKKAISEDQYWPEILTAVISSDQKIGVIFDHHDYAVQRWATAHQLETFPTQALHHLANEGLADSVEFRRLARKYLRRARQNQCQILFFPEAIFAEPKTQKILQHLAGSQAQILTLADLAKVKSENKTSRGEIVIYHSETEIEFLQQRAEQLLGKKLRSDQFQTI